MVQNCLTKREEFSKRQVLIISSMKLTRQTGKSRSAIQCIECRGAYVVQPSKGRDKFRDGSAFSISCLQSIEEIDSTSDEIENARDEQPLGKDLLIRTVVQVQRANDDHSNRQDVQNRQSDRRRH